MIRILCVGRLKEPHYQQAAAEYVKRLGKYSRVEFTEIREQTNDNPQVGKGKEADMLLQRLKEGTYAVALDPRGRQQSSEEFSQTLKRPDVTFILGGPDGLAQQALDEADLVLSLSKMTFPHQLARVILLEQIYRGFTILGGEKYHK
jgi:23S rRNA (pseudouridine1915-N3)-methyltransferase